MHALLTRIAALDRRNKIAVQLALDSVLILISFLAAMYFRLDSLRFILDPWIWALMTITAPVTLATLHITGLYRSLVRYISARVLVSVAKGALVSTITLILATFILGVNLPRSLPFIYCIFVFLAIGGSRFTVRYLFRSSTHRHRKPVVIYGAGDAGLQLLNSLTHDREYAPVAFLDDNTKIQKLTIGGLPVYDVGTLDKVIEETGARIVLLAVPSASRQRRREIVTGLQTHDVEIRTVPGMTDIISGKAKISETRMVSPEDLLGRDPVTPITELMQRNITGKVVMVTGAGGSIGSELCRQILAFQPAELVLFEMSEHGLYTIESELADIVQDTCSNTRVNAVLGSVQHEKRLEEIIHRLGVHTIYHAAAYKHVPLIEDNIVEGVRNNVFGTLAIAGAAKRQAVENFILVSTDKAVRPTNVMGASKRLAELICQAFAMQSQKTIFSIVRFGNVLGSSGSVIPRFRAQIERGGPVTVTHTQINRYFMTIPEASQLVIQAGAMAKGGDVFVLDMGPPVKIIDLAIEMIRLYGLQPWGVDLPGIVSSSKGDIQICVTGLRKGEKLFEELLIGNNPASTQHARIMTASEATMTEAELQPALDRLYAACAAFDTHTILSVLRDLPLDYQPADNLGWGNPPGKHPD